MEPTLTVKDVCRILQRTPDHVRGLIKKGEIRNAFKDGGEWRMHKHELEAYIKRQTRQTATKVGRKVS